MPRSEGGRGGGVEGRGGEGGGGAVGSPIIRIGAVRRRKLNAEAEGAASATTPTWRVGDEYGAASAIHSPFIQRRASAGVDIVEAMWWPHGGNVAG